MYAAFEIPHICARGKLRGAVLSGSTFPIAEEHNLIAPLTRYVIAETIRQRFLPHHQFHIGISIGVGHFRHGVLLKDLNQYWFGGNLFKATGAGAHGTRRV